MTDTNKVESDKIGDGKSKLVKIKTKFFSKSKIDLKIFKSKNPTTFNYIANGLNFFTSKTRLAFIKLK